MRTRAEIEADVDSLTDMADVLDPFTLVVLEVLLDIRDILGPKMEAIEDSDDDPGSWSMWMQDNAGKIRGE